MYGSWVRVPARSLTSLLNRTKTSQTICFVGFFVSGTYQNPHLQSKLRWEIRCVVWGTKKRCVVGFPFSVRFGSRNLKTFLFNTITIITRCGNVVRNSRALCVALLSTFPHHGWQATQSIMRPVVIVII